MFLEIKDASDLRLKHTQMNYFGAIIDSMKKGTRNTLVSQLGLYLDKNDIIRCGGRFLNVRLHPKLLPKKSHCTNLCIIQAHRRLLHSGVAHTLSELRKDHWVLQGRSAVRKVIRQCLICLHWEGGPFRTPNFSEFPNFVLSDSSPPFTHVGVDYLGPLFVKDDRSSKNWICLLTCLNVRAIHLELISDMTTDKFLLCIRRFIARRGTPSLIISDNASNFKLGNSVISRIWKHVVRSVDIQSYVADTGITWKFITEMAPWKGGFYERLVGLTKRSLRKALGHSSVTSAELVTLLMEVEAVINSRPLTYIDSDVNSGQTITPSHFLSLNQKTGCPDFDVDNNDFVDSGTRLMLMWKSAQNQLNQFWKIWSNEYLQVLRERKAFQLKPVKGEVRRTPKLGETVIVKEDLQPRGKWKIARVEKLLLSDVDKKPRAAQLRLASGLLIKRPFRLLYPLEMDLDENSSSSNTSSGD